MGESRITGFFDSILNTVLSMTVVDVLDIVCVTVIFYFVYKFVRERRAGKLATGLLFVIAFLFVSSLINMPATQLIFKDIFQVGLISLVILFQPELRSALEKVGGQPIKSIRNIGEQKNADEMEKTIGEVCAACGDLSASKTGALIVFERTTRLKDLMLTGTIINADATRYLIKNIFFNKAPLHDGALILREGRLYAAGCILPLSSNQEIFKDLGTRHRAAIGMSENSDAIIVVVSEETGVISVAYDGKLSRGYSADSLCKRLRGILLTSSAVKKKRRSMRDKNAADAVISKGKDTENGMQTDGNGGNTADGGKENQ